MTKASQALNRSSILRGGTTDNGVRPGSTESWSVLSGAIDFLTTRSLCENPISECGITAARVVWGHEAEVRFLPLRRRAVRRYARYGIRSKTDFRAGERPATCHYRLLVGPETFNLCDGVRFSVVVRMSRNMERNRQWWRERRTAIRKLIDEKKTNTPCADCGIQYPFPAMEFDHVRGTKLFNLASATAKARTLQAVEEEMAKCEIVCANCHAVRTYNSKDPEWKAQYQGR